jgi:hypothetical protein
MTAILEPAKGQRVDLELAFRRYTAKCKAEGRESVPPDIFMDAMARFCRTVGIKTKIIDDRIYLLNVQLVHPVVTEQATERA